MTSSSVREHQAERHYAKCAIEWCDKRARTAVAGTEPPITACKKHAVWLAASVPGTKIGYRLGHFAARCKLEDYVFGRMPQTLMSSDGRFELRCAYCRALRFASERVKGTRDEDRWVFAKCCNHGKLRDIPCLPPAPTELAALLSGKCVREARYPYHPFSKVGIITSGRMPLAEFQLHKHFTVEVRRYNTALGFASYCDQIEKSSPLLTGSRGPPVYILKGRAYHMVGTLYPNHGERPRYAQLYILDPAEARDHRLATFETLKKPILERLQGMLEEPVRPVDAWTGMTIPTAPYDYPPRNPYPDHLLSMHMVIQNQKRKGGGTQPMHTLRSAGAVDKDPRTYNKPTSAEISCAVVGDGPLPEHFISIYERADDGGSTHTLSPLSEHVDPLAYPLLHVDGTLGYSTALLDREWNTISTCDFYCHRIMQRCRSDSGYVGLPLGGGRLFQQYVVDAYVKVETDGRWY